MSEPMEPAQVDVDTAWSRVMGDIRAVAKTGRNETGTGYWFRGIDAVMNAAGPAMRTHGVHVRPLKVLSLAYVDVIVGSRNTAMMSVRIMVKYRVTGPGGDHFDGVAPGEAFDSGDKGTAKAMSVAYRTFLLQSLTLPTDDPDPDAQTHERAGTDEHAAMLADLGRWRGEVAAAGSDKAKLGVLWSRMKAEWDSVPWSPDRLEIIQAAVDAAKEQPEQQPEQQPEIPTITATKYADDFLTDLAQAEEAKDARAVRELIKQAHDDKMPDLKAKAQTVLNKFRANR